MAKVDNKASNTQIMQMHSMKRKHGVVGKIDEIDLGCTDIIMYNSSKCLNVADPNKLPMIIRPNPDVCLISYLLYPCTQSIVLYVLLFIMI